MGSGALLYGVGIRCILSSSYARMLVVILVSSLGINTLAHHGVQLRTLSGVLLVGCVEIKPKWCQEYTGRDRSSLREIIFSLQRKVGPGQCRIPTDLC